MAVLDNEFSIPGGRSYIAKGQHRHWYINAGDQSTKLFQANSFKDELMAAWYQAREDERLGRFRLPDVPDKVAYRSGIDNIRIVDEVEGLSQFFTKESRPLGAGWEKLCVAAFEHFYPEPEKPWMDAEVGSVWIVKDTESSEEFAATFTQDETFETVYDAYYPHDYKEWISARQIWPEVAE